MSELLARLTMKQRETPVCGCPVVTVSVGLFNPVNVKKRGFKLLSDQPGACRWTAGPLSVTKRGQAKATASSAQSGNARWEVY